MFEIVMRIAGHMRIEESENKTKNQWRYVFMYNIQHSLCLEYEKAFIFILSFFFGHGTHKIIWFENKNAIFYHNFEIDKYEYVKILFFVCKRFGLYTITIAHLPQLCWTFYSNCSLCLFPL